MKIVFIRRADYSRQLSGRHVSTSTLVSGLNSIGVEAEIIPDNNITEADFYAVDALEDIECLPDVDKSKKIAWIRRDVYNGPLKPGPLDSVGTIFCCSQYTANFWPNRTVKILPNAVDHIDLSERNITENSLLYVGRVCKRKGILTLLQMLTQLPEKYTLTCVGPVLQDFSGFISIHNLADRVTFIGMVPTSEVYSYYRKAHCTIIPSYAEPFGRAVIESIACGCTPIIIQGSGGPEEILGNIEHPYVSDPNPVSLAKCVTTITTNRENLLTPEFCHNFIQHYTKEFIAQRFIDYLLN